MFHDKYRDVMLNPSVIIEVLSQSSEAFERGEKFRRYRTWLLTLTDYILVLQDRPMIEHYRRQSRGQWILSTLAGLDAALKIESIGCSLKLGDVYDGVQFHSQNASIEDDLPV
jgi:Uma2 family endonuclease